LNIKINEDKTQAIYFPQGRRPPAMNLILNGQNTPFVDYINYLGAIYDTKITWGIHITIEAKAF
jgi:hypothetical protein